MYMDQLLYKGKNKNKIKKFFGWTALQFPERELEQSIQKKAPQKEKGAILPFKGGIYREFQTIAFTDVANVWSSGEGDDDAFDDILVD